MSRPEYIPREDFREWASAGQNSKLYSIGGKPASSFIAMCSHNKNPVRSMQREKKGYGYVKLYRPLDVIAKAKAMCLEVGPPYEAVVRMDIESLEAQRDALQQKVVALEKTLMESWATEELQRLAELCGLKELFSERDIVLAAKPFVRQCGIYFLVNNSKVVYVGQSVHASARIISHVQNKKFDKVTFIPCKQAHLDVLESLYIHHFRPPLNGGGVDGRIMSAPLSIATITEIVGMARIEMRANEEEAYQQRLAQRRMNNA